ncbi:MAG: ATP-dependent helicase [Proteobacteria bacterium]|nr:ATP-dependent helicase [Pseudomonadota bacterium]
MHLTELQNQVISDNSNYIVIGGPGTGKTTILLTKIKNLISSGVASKDIAVACFNPKHIQLFRGILEKSSGSKAKDIHLGTLNDLAIPELKAVNALKGTFAEEAQTRRLMHQVKILTHFKGSLIEMDHIIKTFKSKAKKPQEGEEFYEVFAKYQDLLTSRGFFDRYDCLRQHLIAMRNNIANPNSIKHLFIDNAQDTNYIQVLWMLEHAEAGIKVNLFLDDDQCLYQRSGAVGSKVVDIVTDCEIPFKKIILNKSFRLSTELSEAAYKVVSLADQRYKKGELETSFTNGNLFINKYNSRKQEVDSVISSLKQFFKKNAKSRVAVITRSDNDAMYISNLFKEAGVNHEKFYKSIWEMPGAIVIIDMLELLMGNSTDRTLKNVLISLGLGETTVNLLFAKGVQSKEWLQNGAKLDKSAIQDDSELKNIIKIQEILTSYYKLRTKLSIKDIFKSLCFELMKEMNVNDKIYALRAIESVLAFKGNMQKNIDKARSKKTYRFNHPIMLGSVKEIRNLEFDAVFMPFCDKDKYPYDYKVLGIKNSNDRRIFFTSMTRSKGDIYISYSKTPSTYTKALEDLQKSKSS